MSCNSCAKPFSLLRKEKGCPSCGFSYCSKCLAHKIFVPKLNAEAKVCQKCKNSSQAKDTKSVEPPDAYYKRIGLMKSASVEKNVSTSKQTLNTADQEIYNRLLKLKEDSKKPQATEEEIVQRLNKIKGDIPKTTDEELQERLAKLRGVPISTVQTQPVLIAPDTRTEQEQADDLMKQYMEQANIDTNYKDQFDGLVQDIESRLGKLKGADGQGSSGQSSQPLQVDPEDENEYIKKIIEKAKKESALEEDEIAPNTNDELPFCEICNEDATLRCLGCRYLFCKRCYMEHKDDDDGCNRYEPYSPPKGTC